MDIGLSGIFHILIDHCRNGRVLQIPVELSHIQSQIPGDLLNLGIVEVFLVGVKFFLELPKFPLFRGRKGGNSSLAGIMVAWKGELLHHQLHILRIFLQHLLE